MINFIISNEFLSKIMSINKLNSTSAVIKLTKIPFPLTGKFPHDLGFTEHCLNANMTIQIQKVQEYLQTTHSFHQQAEEYKNALTGKVQQNKFLLEKKIQENPHFSAMFCIRMKDIEGLKLIVANGWGEVNKQDTLGRAAIHFAAMQDNPEFVRVLLLHEAIDLSLKTRQQNLPKDVAKSKEIFDLLTDKQQTIELKK